MLAGDGYDVIGVTVGGPQPLGQVQLELNPGLTVLYGRNGSGKTRLLTALAEATGLAASTARGIMQRELLVRVSPDRQGDEQPQGWLRQAHHALEHAVTDEAQRRLSESRASEASDLLEDAPEGLADLSRAAADMRLWADVPGIVERIGSDGYLVVRSDPAGLKLGPAVTTDACLQHWEDLLWDAVTFGDVAVAFSLELPIERLEFPRVHLDPAAALADRFLEPRAIADVERGEIGAHDYRDSWNARLVGPVGVLPESPVQLCGWSSDPGSLRARTLDVLQKGSEGRIVDAVVEDEVQLTTSADEVVRRLNDRVSFFYEATMMDAPALRLRVGAPDEWLLGTAPQWEAQDAPTETWINLDDLSSAQRRWAVLAVELALAEAVNTDRPTVVLLDEPEKALHRAAEAHLVNGLRRIALELTGAAVVVATHSPVFLADGGVRAIHVFRSRKGLATVSSLGVGMLDEVDRATTLERLGLRRADQLQLARLAVLVEGSHDVAVVKTMAAGELDEHWALLLPMRGAKNAKSVVDAHLLMTMTDAAVLVVLDNIAEGQLRPRWEALRAAAEGGDRRRLRQLCREIEKVDSAEGSWLAELATRAIEMDRLDRIHVFGLSQPDIIYYLDPTDFGLSEAWTGLEAEWLRLAKPRPPFKQWLREVKGASISVQRIERSARRMAGVPADLEELREAIRVTGLVSSMG